MSHRYSGPDWGFPKSVQILELTFNSKEESNGRTQIRRKRIQTFSRPFCGTVERGSFPRIPGHLQFLKDSIAGRTPNVQSVGQVSRFSTVKETYHATRSNRSCRG
jgi:hypothetical protein